ncbi:hypothetical protein ABT160_12110 [Streptomyces sp. NPDC001941]|uniref:hypothetical protein n=1 Tax=Streptomyces sp. NPDC001941 TaxID=3154659 RepID=UPI00332C3895
MTYLVFAHKPAVRLGRRLAPLWRRLADAPLEHPVCARRTPGRRPDCGALRTGARRARRRNRR